ncbi:putative cytoplasmic protein [Yersinia intermedia]|uniref:DnaJ family domain-containing protein n=1 Tax=Yersinia intermedia TaxID=631 RepID=UPI0005DB9F7D|nr:DnaJ family domain-containing protein [Yersinia intermedia]CNB87229.1 putative cytoplasmic protein [Yersinia intermedia]CNG82448.1 putative cytoplasmic protein [Yersinia intermedia]
MELIDQWAERYIIDAQQKGELDNLPGSGKPLHLDDDSLVPPDLSAGYRLLRNAGYLPVELQDRQEALTIVELLSQLEVEAQYTLLDNYQNLRKRLALLELRLRQAGLSTDFLHQEYQHKVVDKLSKEE